MNTISLPKTLPESHKLIVVYSTKLATSETKLATSEIKLQSQLEELKTKAEENQQLKEEVKLLRKLRFAHKSEKWIKQDKKQALLFNEAEVQTEPLCASQQQDDSENIITITYTRKKNAGRKKLDPNLLRKEIVHDLSEIEKTCQCGNTMQQIGKDEREELDMEPAKYWVNHHIYPQYACSDCTNQIDESTSEVKSAPNNALIPKSFASPGLLAYLFVSKFEDHLPFYRMERIFSRLQVTLPRATMCNWVIKVTERLKPLLDSMHSDMLRSKLIAADETTLQVMKEPGRKNTSKSYMWIFRGEVDQKSILLYQYHPTRSGKIPSNFLEKFQGCLLTDGYSGYSEVGMRNDVIHAGCWAHARRKFKEAHDVMETDNTRKVLSLIQSLYLIEKKIQIEKLGYDQILSLRQKKSQLIVEELKEFLYSLHVPPKSLLGKAVSYNLNQWEKLLVFLDNPFVPIDNNRIENDIRPFVLGRKNWLFSGSPRGAHASCMIYSLIRTAEANGLEPYQYLRYLLEKLVHLKDEDEEEIAKLAPHQIDPSVLG